ncbi:MAG: hypothetical protein ABI175_09665 [Polyangiales bacterium]
MRSASLLLDTVSKTAFRVVGLGSLVGVGLLVACGGSDSPPGPGPTDTAVADTADAAGDSATPIDSADTADGAVPDTSDAAEVAIDTGPPCEDGGCTGSAVCCSGKCVDLARDPHNCGACGVACSLSQFCNKTKCNDAVFANVCENPNATVVKDPYDPDNAAGRAIGTALTASCAPPPVVVEKDQSAAGVLDFDNRPFGGVGISYLTGGGSFGQKLVDYMDKSALTPIYLTGDGSNIDFKVRRTGTTLVTTPISALIDSHDYFFAELAVEPVSGTLCFSAQGMFGGGTAAAAYWISTEMIPKRATYTDAWYAYEWTDTSGDKLPGAGDTFKELGHGR